MKNSAWFNALDSGWRLALVAVAAIGLVVATYHLTKEAIAYQQRQAELRALTEVLPQQWFDNDPLSQKTSVEHELLGPGQHTVYLATVNNQPSALVIDTVTPKGYNGNIRLLVAVTVNGEITGVRIVKHKETPGLGDGIDRSVSDWVESFNGRSLGNPAPERWAIRREGGEFDQFTGASITPRAVVTAVRDTLQWSGENGLQLFQASIANAAANTSRSE